MEKLWLKNVNDPSKSCDLEAICETVDSALDNIQECGPENFNFSNISSKINAEHLAAVLRVTSHWKNQIRSWHFYLGVCETDLVLEGKNPKDALYGMI